MEVSIIAIAHKGIIDEVLAFEDYYEARKKYLELEKGFNYDEDDLQHFCNVDVKEKGK